MKQTKQRPSASDRLELIMADQVADQDALGMSEEASVQPEAGKSAGPSRAQARRLLHYRSEEVEQRLTSKAGR